MSEAEKKGRDVTRRRAIEKLSAQADEIREHIKKKSGPIDIPSSDESHTLCKLNNIEMHLHFEKVHERLDSQDDKIEKVVAGHSRHATLLDVAWWIGSMILYPTAVYLVYTYIEFKVKLIP